jgi:hypothetical protein
MCSTNVATTIWHMLANVMDVIFKCCQNVTNDVNMPCILIQVNEGIAKKFTLMVKGHLNKVMEFKCNICIIMRYLHSPWNIRIFFNIWFPTNISWNSCFQNYLFTLQYDLTYIKMKVMQNWSHWWYRGLGFNVKFTNNVRIQNLSK